MPTDDAFALLLTWICYGTWLPGDRRGYVSNTLRRGGGFVRKQNRPGMPYAADDPYTRQQAIEMQKGTTVCLAYDDSQCAAESFVEASSGREWRVLRGAVMANHVHLVVADCPIIVNLGLHDNICPPETGYAVFDALGSSDKRLYPYDQFGHDGGRVQHDPVIEAFFEKHLHGQTT